jgi:hypothetical protein
MCTITLTNAQAKFLFKTRINYNAGDGPSSVTIGDLNRDGAPDLAVANEWSDNVAVLINIEQVADADTGGGVRGVIPDKMSY